jgi:hypothetical protein
MPEITMKINVSEDFLSNVLITAFDGGYGGCWYWASPHGDDAWDIRGGVWHSVMVEESEGDEEGAHMVNHAVVLRGIERLVNGEVRINSELLAHLDQGLREDDAGEVDADVADCIVQAGVFGELVYG